MNYIPRVAEHALKQYLRTFSVVGVTGPRQSGKSTTLQQILGDTYRYVTFDDFRMVDLFHHDPEQFMRAFSDRVVFDEVQKAPDLFGHIKPAVDGGENIVG